MASVVWTRERDRELALRYHADEPVDQIALAFGVQADMIRRRAAALGLLRRKLKADTKPAGGNAGWVVGVALRAALPVPNMSFAADLVAQLDDLQQTIAAE